MSGTQSCAWPAWLMMVKVSQTSSLALHFQTTTRGVGFTVFNQCRIYQDCVITAACCKVSGPVAWLCYPYMGLKMKSDCQNKTWVTWYIISRLSGIDNLSCILQCLEWRTCVFQYLKTLTKNIVSHIICFAIVMSVILIVKDKSINVKQVN